MVSLDKTVIVANISASTFQYSFTSKICVLKSSFGELVLMVIPKESVSLQSIGKTIRKPHKFVLNPPAQPFPSLPKQSKQNKRRRRRRWRFSTSLSRIRERNSDISVTKDVFRFRIVSFPTNRHDDDSDKFPGGNKSFIDSWWRRWRRVGRNCPEHTEWVVKLRSFHDLFHRARRRRSPHLLDY